MSRYQYKFRNEIITMGNEAILAAFDEAEAKTRTDKFAVISEGVTPQIKEDIKQHWPDDVKNWIKEEMASIAQGGPYSAAHFKTALENVLSERARQRAKRRGGNLSWALEQEFRYMAVDYALALLLQRAPTLDPDSLSSTFGEYSIRVKTSDGPKSLVIPTGEVAQHKIYLFGLFDRHVKRVWFLGWAGQKDLETAPSGSRSTNPDNCRWDQESHYIHYQALRPMAQLLGHLGISQIPKGVVMEKVPQQTDLPVDTRLPSLRDPSAPDPGDAFYDVIFGEEKTSAQPQSAQEDKGDPLGI